MLFWPRIEKAATRHHIHGLRSKKCFARIIPRLARTQPYQRKYKANLTLYVHNSAPHDLLPASQSSQGHTLETIVTAGWPLRHKKRPFKKEEPLFKFT
jgi:hypothetical protein